MRIVFTIEPRLGKLSPPAASCCTASKKGLKRGLVTIGFVKSCFKDILFDSVCHVSQTRKQCTVCMLYLE
jgi:hypothetical protein